MLVSDKNVINVGLVSDKKQIILQAIKKLTYVNFLLKSNLFFYTSEKILQVLALEFSDFEEKFSTNENFIVIGNTKIDDLSFCVSVKKNFRNSIVIFSESNENIELIVNNL